MRVLIAGLGAIGQRHARNLRLLRSDVELVAYRRRRRRHVVTDALTQDTSRDVEQELSITSFDDLAAALATKPDAVFVCNPTSQHLDVALRAASAGCDLFIEKPVSHSLDDLIRLETLVGQNKLIVTVGCQWRFHPLIIALKTVLDGGILGTIDRADIEYAEYLPDWHPYEDYRESYAARRDLGGGVVLSQIHDYDLAWWLFGSPRTVLAEGGHLSSLEIDVEDTVMAHLKMDSTDVFVSQSFATLPPKRRLAVQGSRAVAIVDLLVGSLTIEPALLPPQTLSNYSRNNMFLAEVESFISCVETRTNSITPLSDGIAVLKIALAVKDSLRSGSLIQLN